MTGIKREWGNASLDQTRLFHASSAREITRVLEPRFCRASTGEEGNFIFASPDFVCAHAYALKTRDMLCIHYMPGFPDMNVHACVIRDRDKHLREGVTGSIYEVPAQKFRRLAFPSGELSGDWVAEEPVFIEAEKAKLVTLDTALGVGIQVFFAPPDVDESIIGEIYDQGWRLKSWEDSKLAAAWREGRLSWENYDRGIAPIFPRAPVSPMPAPGA